MHLYNKEIEDKTMKVFVSWSGELSQKFAGALKEWLEQCIQSVEVFFSSEDIEKGDNWQLKLSNELQDTNYGIVCLTTENIDAPWIHFEAGALSKMLDSKVMILAMNVNFSDIKGPLKAFQATKFERDDILKLLKTINSVQEKPLGDEKLKNSFEAFWPQFKDKIDQIKNEVIDSEDKKTSKVNVSETVDEILQIVRTQSALLNNPEKLLPEEYLTHAFGKNGQSSGNEERIFDEIYSFTQYILVEYGQNIRETLAFWDSYYLMLKRISSENPTWRRRFSHLLSRIKNRIKEEAPIIDDEHEE